MCRLQALFIYHQFIKSSCASIVKLQVRTHPCRIRRLSWSDSASAWQTWLLSTAGPIYLSIYPLSCWWSFWFREGASNHRPDALAGAAPTMIQFSSPTTTWTSPNEGTRVWQVAAQRRRALAPWVRGRDDLGAHGGVGAVESPGIAARTRTKRSHHRRTICTAREQQACARRRRAGRS